MSNVNKKTEGNVEKRGGKERNRREEDEEEEQEEEENFVVTPPNGGWGWVVVFCAFYCNFVIDGIQLTFGVFLTSISEDFAVEYSKVALAGSLMFGVHLMMGPVCAGFNNAFGVRPVSITGSLISGLGIGIAYFSTGCWFLCLSFGVLGGVGFGMVYMNTLIITSLYFTTRLPIALGIVVCGTGVGTMVFAIGGHFLLEVISWRLSFLIEAALVWSLALAAISFRPLKAVKVKMSQDPKQAKGKKRGEDDRRRTSVFIKRDLPTRQSVFSTIASESIVWNKTDIEIPKKRKRCEWLKCCRRKKNVEEPQVVMLSEVQTDAHRMSYVSEYAGEMSTSSSKTVYTRIDIPKKRKGFCKIFKQTISVMLDCRLLTSCSFVVFTLGGAIPLAAFLIVFIYEKDRCEEMGFSKEFSMYFVAALGGVNTFWRLLFGGVGLIAKFRYRIAVVVGQVVGGIATMVSGYNDNLYFQLTFCFFFGMAVASMSVFRVPLTIDLVGMEFLENAVGINLLFMGVACSALPPIFGVIKEKSHSYNLVFLINGSFIIVFGLTLICLKKVDISNIKKLKTIRSRDLTELIKLKTSTVTIFLIKAETEYNSLSEHSSNKLSQRLRLA